jgi:hypothetical protein
MRPVTDDNGISLLTMQRYSPDQSDDHNSESPVAQSHLGTNDEECPPFGDTTNSESYEAQTDDNGELFM